MSSVVIHAGRSPSICSLALLAACALPALAAAADVTLFLRDGRMAQGTVAVHAADDRLWLRASAPGIQATSGFAWEQIREVEVEGRRLSPAEFRRLALPAEPVPPPPPAPAAPPSAESLPPPARPRIAYLEAHAVPANWDADPELDGLRVTLQAIDQQGRPAAVTGQVTARLLAEFRTDPEFRDGRPLTQFTEVADWMRPVAAADFHAGLLVLELPFDRFDPETLVAFAPTGWLRVRLGIPGQGVVEADAIDVPLRPYSRIRDHLQLYRGSRLYPGE